MGIMKKLVLVLAAATALSPATAEAKHKKPTGLQILTRVMNKANNSPSNNKLTYHSTGQTNVCDEVSGSCSQLGVRSESVYPDANDQSLKGFKMHITVNSNGMAVDQIVDGDKGWIRSNFSPALYSPDCFTPILFESPDEEIELLMSTMMSSISIVYDRYLDARFNKEKINLKIHRMHGKVRYQWTASKTSKITGLLNKKVYGYIKEHGTYSVTVDQHGQFAGSSVRLHRISHDIEFGDEDLRLQALDRLWADTTPPNLALAAPLCES